ncbi:MAG: HAD family hydrolase [Flavobacteriaceae bacterium]|nr:HAD family hydrolase [Flavobacteriaceae bacterium]
MKLEYSKYKHISFDLWLTLIKSNPEFKNKRNLLFKDFFGLENTIEKITEVVRYYDVLCNNINEKTGLNFDTFEIYYLILNALNARLDDITTEHLNQFYNETEILFMDNKPELINPQTNLMFKDMISQNKTISILSNTGFIKGYTLRKLIIDYELNDYFKFQIYSDEVGYSKPNPKMFQLVFDNISVLKNIKKQEIIHVGDNQNADYNGAISFGFNAYLLIN